MPRRQQPSNLARRSRHEQRSRQTGFFRRKGGSTTTPVKPSAPDFSDVKAGSSTASAADQSYTVAAGDSLSKIAKKFYGNANAWNTIFQANRDKISNPDMIHPGQVLRIPAK
jgi:nucleoid-associated protein YgaU